MKIIYLILKKATCLSLLKVVGFAFIIIFLQGCLKDDYSKLSVSGWRPDLATALINTQFALKDFLKDDKTGTIQEDPATNFLTIVYHDSPFSYGANDVMKLDSQAASISKGLPSGLPPSGIISSDVVLQDSSNDVTSFSNENNVEVGTIKIKSGNIKIVVVSDFEFSGEITITMPTLLDANNKGTTLKVPFKKAPAINDTSSILQNVSMDMSMGGTTSNTIPLKYKIKANLKAGNQFDTSQKITVKILLTNVVFSYVDGYFGSVPLDINDKLDIKVFNNFLGGGSIYLKDPKVNITLNNSYGIPIEVFFDTLRAMPAAGGTPLDLHGPQINNKITINSPALTEVGQSKQTFIKLDTITTSNPGIREFISCSPNVFKYSAKVKTNPNGKTANKNFIIDSSRVSVDIDVDLPLWGSIKNIAALDTFAFDLGKDMDKLESITFKINTDNGFPLDVKLQLYFVDSTVKPYTRLDSLFANTNTTNLLNSGIVDPISGKVLNSTKTTTSITLEEAKLTNIKSTNKIILKATLNTSGSGAVNPPSVRVASTNYLGIKLGARFKLNGDKLLNKK